MFYLYKIPRRQTSYALRLLTALEVNVGGGRQEKNPRIGLETARRRFTRFHSYMSDQTQV